MLSGKTPIPKNLGNSYFITIDQQDIMDIANRVHNYLKSFESDFLPNIRRAKEIKALIDSGEIEEYIDWLKDLENAYSSYIELHTKLHPYLVSGQYAQVPLSLKRDLIYFLKLIWADKRFGSVGRHIIGVPYIELHLEYFFEFTCKIIEGVKQEYSIEQLLAIGPLSIDNRGDLVAPRVRAISILTDLALPSMFSKASYNFLYSLFELKDEEYAQGLITLKQMALSFLPIERRKDRLVVFILPWVLYAYFSREREDEIDDSSENIGEPPEAISVVETVEINTQDKRSYWLLYCNPRSWNFDTKVIGEPAVYNAYYNATQKRPDYNNIITAEAGDIVLAYGDSDLKEIKAILKVTKEARDNVPPYGELSMVFQHIFKQGIPLKKVESLIKEATGGVFPSGPGTFFSINEKNFYAIINSAGVTSEQFPKLVKVEAVEGVSRQLISNTVTLATHINSDQPSLEDYLGHRPYASAISSIMRDDKTAPPLTIAIMAPWGQGKTTIMRFIKQDFDDTNTEQIKNATKVEENSWHTEIKNKTTATFKKLNEWINSPDFTGNIKQNNPTIWFNPWQYQSSEQIWAGMAHAIIKQMVAKLPAAQQEEFWFKLQLARIDTQAIRRDIVQAVAFKLLPFLLAYLAALIVGAIVFVKYSSWGGGSIIGAFSAASVIHTLLAYNSKLSEKLEGKYISYVKEPNYEEKLGIFHHINIDLQRVFTLLVDKPAVIFIDDLDRCSPSKIVEVVEAMNLMINGDFGNKCYFVIGMDHHVVSASLDVAYVNMHSKLKETGREFESVGTYFLDKFIQLPFYLPTMSETKKEQYLARLLNKNITEPTQTDDVVITNDIQSIISATTTHQSQEIAGKYLGTKNETVFIRRFLNQKIKNNSDSPEINNHVQSFSKYLSSSPRDIKRFTNLLRFYSAMQDVKKLSKDTESAAAPTVALAKWLIIGLRYPSMIRWIQWQRVGELAESDDPILKARKIDNYVNEIIQNNDKDQMEKAWKDKFATTKHTWLREDDLMRILLNEETLSYTLESAINADIW